MKVALALALLPVVAHADALPREYEDLGACQAIAYEGKQLLRTHDYQRDREGRLEWERTTLAGGSGVFTVSYARDKQGRLISASHNGDHTEFEYDAKTGKLVKTTSYDKPTSKTKTWIWTYRYDSDGRQVQTTAWSRAANAITIDKRYTYDKGRLAKIEFSDGTIETRTYDTRGLVVATDEVLGTTRKRFTYKYDAKRRLIEQATGNGRIEYRYDCGTGKVAPDRPSPAKTDVRPPSVTDKPGYCGRPNCGKPRGLED